MRTVRLLVLICVLVGVAGIAQSFGVEPPSCSAALLVIDVQQMFLENDDTADDVWIADRIAHILEAVRRTDLRVVFTLNMVWRHRVEQQVELLGPPETFHWEDDEITFRRFRPDPFNAGQLGRRLRDLGIQRLLLCGRATSGAVAAAVDGALVEGFEVIIIEDAHADGEHGEIAHSYNEMW